VKKKFERGNLSEAISSAKNSKILSLIAIGLLVLNLIFLLSFGGIAAYQEILENYNFTQ
jgi:hypothetical protein